MKTFTARFYQKLSYWYGKGGKARNGFIKKKNQVQNRFDSETDTDDSVEDIFDDVDNNEIISLRKEEEIYDDDLDDLDDLSVMTALDKEDGILKEDHDDSTCSKIIP